MDIGCSSPHIPQETNSSLGHHTSSYVNTRSSRAQTSEFQLPSVHHIQQESPLSMKNEVDRFQTFTIYNWQGRISPRDLARAGFYYYGKGDSVKCAFCQNDIEHWEEGDEPLQEHRRHFPFCRFIRGIDVGNLPRPGTANPVPYAPDEAGHDVCGIRPMVRQPSEINHTILPKGSKLKEGVDLTKVGVVQTQVPKFPHLATKEARLLTFHLWPSALKTKPKDLAEAGFFYTESGDRVKCFQCNGGLAGWEDNDDPWEEHARHYPFCSFVLQNRGQAFVENATKKKMNLNSRSHEGGDSSVVNENDNMDTDVKLTTEVSHNSEDSSDNTVKKIVCRVCLDEDSEIVFLPCGHLTCCLECAPQLSNCPLCRRDIQATVRIFTC